MEKNENEQLTKIRSFYDSVYYKNAYTNVHVSRHYEQMAENLGISPDMRVLDVACGTGEWLLACSNRGATISGIDLSGKAISVCKNIMPEGDFRQNEAESLPYENGIFDVVTCLGSLEHFVQPVTALKEMVRVAKKEARFIILVPNADFLTRRLGLYSGTYQVEAKEHVRSLDEWEKLFAQAGLTIEDRWKDLHVLSWKWITSSTWYTIPLRAAQALALASWPLKWQYQVYHLCTTDPA
jgi:ubiquinone/menaquinone biosynthesis C-methylase UbiE